MCTRSRIRDKDVKLWSLSATDLGGGHVALGRTGLSGWETEGGESRAANRPRGGGGGGEWGEPLSPSWPLCPRGLSVHKGCDDTAQKPCQALQSPARCLLIFQAQRTLGACLRASLQFWVNVL